MGRQGESKEEVWRIRGGHRLWIAPEDFGKDDSLSYALDNSEVEHTIEDESTVRVSNLIEKPTKIRREIVVTLEKASPKITVEHRITNQGDAPLEVAPWALSVMAAGGYALLSQPPQGTHPQDYLPESLDRRVAIHRSFRGEASRRTADDFCASAGSPV